MSDDDVKIRNYITSYINNMSYRKLQWFVYFFLTLKHYPLGNSNAVAMLNVFNRDATRNDNL